MGQRYSQHTDVYIKVLVHMNVGSSSKTIKQTSRLGILVRFML